MIWAKAVYENENELSLAILTFGTIFNVKWL